MIIKPFDTTSGTGAVNAFFNEKIDVAFMGLTPFVLAATFGLNIKLLGVVHQCKTSHGVALVRPKEPRTMKIGTVFGSTGHLVAYNWAKARNEDVRFIDLPPGIQVEALKSGKLDGVSCWEPFFSKARSIATSVYTADQVTNVYNCLVATKDALNQHGSLVQSFLSAHNEAVGILKNNNLNESTGVTLHSLYNLLAGVFDSYGDIYHRILGDRYEWHDIAAGQKPTKKIREAIEFSFRFLLDSGLAGPYKIKANSVCASMDDFRDAGTATKVVSIGYSHSIMCAPFHIAEVEGFFREKSITVVREGLRVHERRLSLPKHYQGHIDRLLSNELRNPNNSIIQFCRIVESSIKSVFFSVIGFKQHISLQAASSILCEMGIVPKKLYPVVLRICATFHLAQKNLIEDIGSELSSLVGNSIEVFEWIDNSKREAKGRDYNRLAVDHFTNQISEVLGKLRADNTAFDEPTNDKLTGLYSKLENIIDGIEDRFDPGALLEVKLLLEHRVQIRKQIEKSSISEGHANLERNTVKIENILNRY